jgi:dipeptidyl aminopeptidase/acylaminoacyl peptidase
MSRLVAATLMLLLGSALSTNARAADEERREIGTLTLDHIPPIPDGLDRIVQRYQNARSAQLQSWMADGSLLIATRFGATPQVHRVGTPLGMREQLTFFSEPISDARGRPVHQDQYLAIVDNGGDENFQIHLRSLAGDDQVLTQADTRNEEPRFSSDGRFLAWAMAKGEDVTHYIVLADLEHPQGRRILYQTRGAILPLAFSSDGRRLLAIQEISNAAFRLFVIDIASGKSREVNASKGPLNYADARFTPDGTGVIALTDEGSEYLGLIRYDLKTGARTRVSPVAPWDIEAFDISADGRTLAYTLNEDGVSRIVVRNLLTGALLPAPELPPGQILSLAFAPRDDRLAITVTNPETPADVWVWDPAAKQLTPWTRSELGGIDRDKLVAPTLIQARTFDGASVPAFVYRPRGRDGRLPVIISIHGGPDSQARPIFNPTEQMWMNVLGAAVIAPNVRGSTGYGKSYLAADDGLKREVPVRDIGAILDWIRQQPDLDPDRVALYGGSYGGFMVLASMVAYSDRLAGGIDVVGPSNLVTFLERTEGYGRDVRRAEYGDESNPKVRAFLESIAPLNNALKITKPLLVVQGKNDPRVSFKEAEQIVAKVRGAGGEAWYLLASDEGHGYRKKPNRDVKSQVELLFFERVFGAKAAAILPAPGARQAAP